MRGRWDEDEDEDKALLLPGRRKPFGHFGKCGEPDKTTLMMDQNGSFCLCSTDTNPPREVETPDGRQQTLTKTAEERMPRRTESELRGIKEARVWFRFFDLRYPGLRSVVLGDLALLQELFRRSSFQCLGRWEAVGGWEEGRKEDGGVQRRVKLSSHGANQGASEL